MASIIHFNSHGFDAGDAIYFANLVPSDCGIEEGRTYYVLSSNLTVDDFEFSETDGGAAFVFDFDITDGFVGKISTYAPAPGSDPMAPPDPVPTPGLPALTSALVSGIVRLRVDLAEAAEAKVRAWELNITHKFHESGDPDWDQPLVVVMPSGNDDFSMPALGETVYAVRVRAQDVYGNFSDYCADQTITTEAGSDALNAALALLSEDVLDGIITETKIADNAISTPKLQAGAVTAEVLAATIVLSSLIKTAESGGRVELDVDGVRLYNPDEELTVRIPTDGSAAFFKGEIVAANLSNEGLTELADDVALTGDAVMTLANGVAAPSTPPNLTSGLQYDTLTSTPPNLGYGIFYDPAGDAAGDKDTYWLGADPSASDYVAHEFDATTHALLRSITKTDTFEQIASTLGSTSHVSDTAAATTGGTDSQVASPLTIPASWSNPIIQKVAVWFTGYSSAVQHRVAVWQGNTLLGTSDPFTPTVEALAVGASNKQDRYLDPQLPVFPGNTYRFGFLRNTAAGGSQWDRDDGSSKTLYLGDGENGDMTGVSTDTSRKINVSALVLHDVGSELEGYTGKIIGVTRLDDYVWVLEDTGILYQYNQDDLEYVAQYDHSANITGTAANAGLFVDEAFGGLVIVTTTGTGAGVQLKFLRIDVTDGSLDSTITATGAKTVSGSAAILRGGHHDGTNFWIAIQDAGGSGVYAFDDGTGAYVADRDFGTTANMASGITYDGANFRGYAAASPTKVWKYTNWDWTTASPIYWVAYAWYDSAGTTHETVVSPRASLTLRRRETLSIGTPAIPTGGADDPDNVRIYMLPNATDPGAGALKLQATDALTARTLTTYDSGGAADGGGTPFAAGEPAQLKSSATGWTLKGSGLINRTGTAFPVAPDTGDQYWRSDLGMEFFYDGSQWLSTQVYVKTFPYYTSFPPFSATNANSMRIMLYNAASGASDLWVESFDITFHVASGGSALSASHRWNVTYTIFPSGASFGSGIAINSGSSNVWRSATDTIDALTGATEFMINVAATKTGTPGNLSLLAEMRYRLVAV